MEITHAQEDDICIVTCKGRIDTDNYSEAERAMTDIVEAGHKRLVLDFSALDYISSAGLRTLINLAKRIKREDGVLAIASMNEFIKEVFDIAGFQILIPACESVGDARRLVSGTVES